MEWKKVKNQEREGYGRDKRTEIEQLEKEITITETITCHSRQWKDTETTGDQNTGTMDNEM